MSIEPCIVVNKEVDNLLSQGVKCWINSLNASQLVALFNTAYEMRDNPPQTIPDSATTPTIDVAIIPSLESRRGIKFLDTAAANLGKKGEREFATLCKQLPSNYTLLDTTKIGKKGDFILEYKYYGIKYRCLIDIKNYRSTIPKKEIDKFYEDLASGDYDCGLLISYNSKFTGIDECVYICDKELPAGTIPIMYLADIPDDLILKCLEILFIKTTILFEKRCDTSILDNTINYIRNALNHSAYTRRMLSELNRTVDNSVQSCRESLINLECQIKHGITELTKLMKRDETHHIQPTQYALHGSRNHDQSDHKTYQIEPLDNHDGDISHPTQKETPSLCMPIQKETTSLCMPADLSSAVLDAQNATLDIPPNNIAAKSNIDVTLFNSADRMHIRELCSLPWSQLITQSNTIDILLEGHAHFKLASLKTKTKIQLVYLKPVATYDKIRAEFINKKNQSIDFTERILQRISTGLFDATD